MKENVKYPNYGCPQREQCVDSKTRWITCKLRKEYICHQIDEERKKIINKQKEQQNAGKDIYGSK